MNISLATRMTTYSGQDALPIKTFPAFTGHGARKSAEWFMQDTRWSRSRRFCRWVLASFTVHPSETNENYLQHLWFTTRMSSHFVLLAVLLFTHGIFPFLFTRTVSTQMEGIHRIMKSRVPVRKRMTNGEYEI